MNFENMYFGGVQGVLNFIKLSHIQTGIEIGRYNHHSKDKYWENQINLNDDV